MYATKASESIIHFKLTENSNAEIAAVNYCERDLEG
jgi:hypothetical protein